MDFIRAWLARLVFGLSFFKSVSSNFLVIPLCKEVSIIPNNQGIRRGKNVPKAAKSSLASANSPSSIPSPTYQWTKALFAYIRSNLWFNLTQASAIAVVLDNMETDLSTSANSDPGTLDGFWWLIPSLKPVGHHSTKLKLALALRDATAAVQSRGMTSPR